MIEKEFGFRFVLIGNLRTYDQAGQYFFFHSIVIVVFDCTGSCPPAYIVQPDDVFIIIKRNLQRKVFRFTQYKVWLFCF